MLPCSSMIGNMVRDASDNSINDWQYSTIGSMVRDASDNSINDWQYSTIGNIQQLAVFNDWQYGA